MKHLDTDESKQPAFIIKQDVEAQHKKYWPLHKKANQELALKVKEIAATAYFRSRVFLNNKVVI